MIVVGGAGVAFRAVALEVYVEVIPELPLKLFASVGDRNVVLLRLSAVPQVFCAEFFCLGLFFHGFFAIFQIFEDFEERRFFINFLLFRLFTLALLVFAFLAPRTIASGGSDGSFSLLGGYFHLYLHLGCLLEVLVGVVDFLGRDFGVQLLGGEVLGVPEVPARQQQGYYRDDHCVDSREEGVRKCGADDLQAGCDEEDERGGDEAG